MSLIHPDTCECFYSGLDLFNVPPTHTDVDESQNTEVRPLAALAPGAPIKFVVQGNSEHEWQSYHAKY